MQRLEGPARRKSFLNPKALATASGKLRAGKLARTVWAGGDGKGLSKHRVGVLLHLGDVGKGPSEIPPEETSGRSKGQPAPRWHPTLQIY